MSDGEFSHADLADDADLKQAVPRRSQPAKHGEGFDAPPTLERSGSEHRRAVTSFPLMVKGKAWVGIKDPPAGEGQVGQKNTSLAKEKQAESKKQYLNLQLTFPKEKNRKSEAS